MNIKLLRKSMLSTYFILILLSAGFTGILVFETGIEPVTAAPSEIIVDINGGGAYTSIQAGIDAAKPGDTIFVWAGTYYENAVVNKTITLVGNGTEKTIIDAGDYGNVVLVTADRVNITGFRLQNSNHTFPDYEAGIRLESVKYAHLYNNNCTGNHVGIILENTTDSVLENNEIYDNYATGIRIDSSSNNKFWNNSCRLNNEGLYLYYSDKNNISHNKAIRNQYGFYIISSKNADIRFNNCSLNNYEGIYIRKSYSFNIINNTASHNSFGILIRESNVFSILNNTCKYNKKTGINLTISYKNIIENNSCYYNKVGIQSSGGNNEIEYNRLLTHSHEGIDIWDSNDLITHNIIDTGFNGIVINGNSNLVKLNNFTNVEWGIGIGGNNNFVYHNNFYINVDAATDMGFNNRFDNGYGEGNFWSDYDGLDNGLYNRQAGDGIGDSKTPHDGVDNFPFTNRSGWLYPGIPKLAEPGPVNTDGHYSILWFYSRNPRSFTLEEDVSPAFTSPAVAYNGEERQVGFTAKPNGTYNYRVRANSEHYSGSWSNTVSILVDWSPSAPEGLVIKNISGKSVQLSWSANPEPDIEGYHVFINKSGAGAAGPFGHIKTVLGPSAECTITGLVEETDYYVVISAFDKYSNSSFSEAVSAKTLDVTVPQAPSGLIATAVTDTVINLSWNQNPEPDLAGYIIFMNSSGEGEEGEYDIAGVIYGSHTKFSVTGLTEETSYYFKLKAFDEVPNNSSFSKTANATTPDITPPRKPEGLYFSGITCSSMTLNWKANTEQDVVGYRISCSDGTELYREQVDAPFCIFTNLSIDTEYKFTVTALDNVGLGAASEITGRTESSCFDPTLYPPEAIKNPYEIWMEEDTEFFIHLDNLFFDRNGDELLFHVEGRIHVNTTINYDNQTLLIEPEPDWSGYEEISVFANDSTLPAVESKLQIHVTAVNDRPYVKIDYPLNNSEWCRSDPNFVITAECVDPDIPYGDVLTYKWLSNLQGSLGNTKNLSGILLDEGEHTIFLIVTDSGGLSDESSITLTVTDCDLPSQAKDSDEEVSGDSEKMWWLLGAVISVMLIVAVLLYFFIIRRRRAGAAQAQPEAGGPEVDDGSEVVVVEPEVVSVEESRTEGHGPDDGGQTDLSQDDNIIDIAAVPVSKEPETVDSTEITEQK